MSLSGESVPTHPVSPHPAVLHLLRSSNYISRSEPLWHVTLGLAARSPAALASAFPSLLSLQHAFLGSQRSAVLSLEGALHISAS